MSCDPIYFTAPSGMKFIYDPITFDVEPDLENTPMWEMPIVRRTNGWVWRHRNDGPPTDWHKAGVSEDDWRALIEHEAKIRGRRA